MIKAQNDSVPATMMREDSSSGQVWDQISLDGF